MSDRRRSSATSIPFDTYERLKAHAAKNEYPKPADNFRWRYFGLFYVAPNQNSYMCRLRLPNGILKSAQLAGLADLAERYGGGYAHVTTRANIQIREIEAKNSVAMIEAIQDLGLCSRGSGADNIRNVTGTPTAGIDPQELIDTRPYAREWHFHILNDRSLYGLPRKFNVGFDGAGLIPVLEDTNDIGFQAVQVNDGFGLEPGVRFRLCLGGLTGHRSFAGDTGVIVRPADATLVADAVVRVFIDHGDRTDRTKARLKYVLEKMGVEKFVAARGGKAWPQARPGGARRSRAAAAVLTYRAYRYPRAEAGRAALDRRRGAGRLSRRCADARACRYRARVRRRRYPSYGLAKSPNFGRADRQARRGAPAYRRARPCQSRRMRFAPVLSPAPAIPAANSPLPTPSGTPKRSHAGARHAFLSTHRSTFI